MLSEVICSNISVSNFLIQNTWNNRLIEFDFFGKAYVIYLGKYKMFMYILKSNSKGNI